LRTLYAGSFCTAHVAPLVVDVAATKMTVAASLGVGFGGAAAVSGAWSGAFSTAAPGRFQLPMLFVASIFQRVVVGWLPYDPTTSANAVLPAISGKLLFHVIVDDFHRRFSIDGSGGPNGVRLHYEMRQVALSQVNRNAENTVPTKRLSVAQ
jgi:hypothetical protein